jgi:hypothetical protein
MNGKAFSPSQNLEISEQMQKTAPNPERLHVQPLKFLFPTSDVHLHFASPRILVLDIRQIQHSILIEINQAPNPIGLLHKRASTRKDFIMIATRLAGNMNLRLPSSRIRIFDNTRSAVFHPE